MTWQADKFALIVDVTSG